MGPIQSMEDLIGMIRRRFWLILFVTAIGSLSAAWFAKTRPDVYETAAVLEVELPMVTDGGQAPALPVNVLQLLTSIEQRLTTRENLIALIDRHNLFTDAPALTLEDRVAAMRASIRFESVTGQSGALSALIISARASTADDAARIANVPKANARPQKPALVFSRNRKSVSGNRLLRWRLKSPPIAMQTEARFPASERRGKKKLPNLIQQFAFWIRKLRLCKARMPRSVRNRTYAPPIGEGLRTLASVSLS